MMMIKQDNRPATPKTRTQRRASRVRSRLQQAALNRFAEKGVDATTIEEITEQADLGKGTFYRHFSDKADILAALLRQAIDDLLVEVRGACQEAKTLEDVLQALLRAHGRFFLAHREEFLLLFQGRLILQLERDETGEVEEPFLDYLRELEAQLRPFVPESVDQRKVRRLVCALAGFMSGFLSFAEVGMTPEELEESLTPVRQAFVAGSSAILLDAG